MENNHMATNMDESALDLFTSSAERLVEVTSRLELAQLDYVPAPGEWTIRQLIHHVTDDCDFWSMAFKKAFATPGAVMRFEGFPGNEAWAEGMDFCNLDVRPALALIQAHHTYLAYLLRHFSQRWENWVVALDAQSCPVQEFNVREIVNMLTAHMLEHLDTIEAILAKANRNN
jgi:hypothetical protein